MTYLGLLALCLLPPILGLLHRARGRDVAPHISDRRQAGALGGLVALALLATVPWDAALIARGTWTYPHGHLVGHLAGVPVEELLFMVLQPVLVGLWLRGLPPSLLWGPQPPRPGARSGRARRSGCLVLLAVGAGGAGAAGVSPHGSYLGWLLAWAVPVLALQWAVGGDVLWAYRRLLAAAVVPPVLYLCAVDRLALGLGLWRLSPARTLDLTLLGLPVEESVFFAATSLLVVAGVLLATDRAVLRRLRSRRPAQLGRLGDGSFSWTGAAGATAVRDGRHSDLELELPLSAGQSHDLVLTLDTGHTAPTVDPGAGWAAVQERAELLDADGRDRGRQPAPDRPLAAQPGRRAGRRGAAAARRPRAAARGRPAHRRDPLRRPRRARARWLPLPLPLPLPARRPAPGPGRRGVPAVRLPRGAVAARQRRPRRRHRLVRAHPRRLRPGLLTEEFDLGQRQAREPAGGVRPRPAYRDRDPPGPGDGPNAPASRTCLTHLPHAPQETT